MTSYRFIADLLRQVTAVFLEGEKWIQQLLLQS